MSHRHATWIDTVAPSLREKVIATASMEGYIPELHGDAREANMKGGLGVYFGDKLEGLAAIGIRHALGCMPLYHRRLAQVIQQGRQAMEAREVSYADQPITRLCDAEGRPVTLEVWGFDTQNPNQEVRYDAEVFCVNRGGTPLYLFHCPAVFDVLYPDRATHNSRGRRHRFLQETVFAQCVPQLLKQLGTVPDVLLINEGHVAVAAAIIHGDPTFSKTAIVYTNHTVVSAGLEVFDVDDLAGNDVGRARYIMRFPPNSWQWLWQKFIVECNGKILIDFSKGALEICSAANAVSAEHARVTRDLFPGHNRKIVPILNGSGDSWVHPELIRLERKGEVPSPEQLMEVSRQGKAEAFAAIRQRTAGMTNQQGQVMCPDGILLDVDRPTLWLVRRMVEYKSQYPMLKDIVHAICADRGESVNTLWGPRRGLGMQVVVGGVAPQHCHEQGWIEEFVRWMQSAELRGRFVFVPGCDTELLRLQAIGADICLNCPQPNKEACGTSDQRSARNGGINIAMRSGGPPEYLEDGKSAMLIGPYINNRDFFELAPRDTLDKLAVLSEMYDGLAGGDRRWLEMKLQAYVASRKVTAMAMEQRYAEIYLQAIHDRQSRCREQELEAVEILALPAHQDTRPGLRREVM
jgi:glucan phosphorylase